MLTCSWKESFGIDCPTCGAQRAFKLLLSGNLWESFLMFPALLPFIATIIFTLLHLKFKFKNGARWIVILFSTTVALIVINYIVKLNTHS